MFMDNTEFTSKSNEQISNYIEYLWGQVKSNSEAPEYDNMTYSIYEGVESWITDIERGKVVCGKLRALNERETYDESLKVKVFEWLEKLVRKRESQQITMTTVIEDALAEILKSNLEILTPPNGLGEGLKAAFVHPTHEKIRLAISNYKGENVGFVEMDKEMTIGKIFEKIGLPRVKQKL